VQSLNAYYQSNIADFIQKSASEILGEMTSNGNFSLELTQRDAREEELAILKDQLRGITGYVFNVPVGSKTLPNHPVH
jgi:hypothetical protein